MKIRHIVFSLIACCSLSAFSMTDKEVIAFIKQQSAAGKTEQQIGQMLMAKGVTPEQAQRIKAQYAEERKENTTSATNLAPMQMTSRAHQADESIQEEEIDETINIDETNPDGMGRRTIFGHNVFNSRTLTFEPNDNLATPQNYRLGPGDEVVIDIWGDAEDHLRQTISPEGSIMISQLGPVYLNGLTIQEAAKHIRKSFAQKYAGVSDSESNIQVTLGQIRTIQVNLMGEVATPGTYVLSPFSTVFHALHRAGGINDIGSLRNIQVLRNGKKVAGIDVYEYLFKGKNSGNIRLEEGDVIIVPPYETLVNVEGNVRRPMYYELKPGETIKNIIDYAGGFTSEAFSEAISIARQNGTENELVNISRQQFPTYTLQDGDVLTVGTILSRISNKVEVRGSVLRPGLYALDSGTSTVKQLIQKGEGLAEDAYTERALIYREKDNLQPEVLAFNLSDLMNGRIADIPLKRNDVIVISSISEMTLVGDVIISGLIKNPGKYPYAANLTLEDLIFRAGGLSEGASTSRVEIARRIVDPTATEQSQTISEIFTVSIENGLAANGGGFLLKPYDEVIIRTSPNYEPQRFVSIEGEVPFHGAYALVKRNERMTEVIKRAGGIIDGAYVKGAHLTRELSEDEYLARTEALHFAIANSNGNQGDSIALSKIQVSRYYNVGIDLEKALANPGSTYDIVLRPGDVLYIPEEQSTVKIAGEVMFPNTVTFEPGKKLKHYIDQAGGYGQRAKKGKAYIVYLNGTVARAKRNTPIEPGCQIIVPTKPANSGTDWSRVMAFATSFSSVAALAATITNIFK